MPAAYPGLQRNTVDAVQRRAWQHISSRQTQTFAIGCSDAGVACCTGLPSITKNATATGLQFAAQTQIRQPVAQRAGIELVFIKPDAGTETNAAAGWNGQFFDFEKRRLDCRACCAVERDVMTAGEQASLHFGIVEPAFSLKEEARPEAKASHDLVQRIGKLAGGATACSTDSGCQCVDKKVTRRVAVRLCHHTGAPAAKM